MGQHAVVTPNGIELIDITPEEQADREAGAVPAAPTPYIYAVAQLVIQDGEISGIDLASKFSAAMWMDVGLYYVFFAESLPDTTYLAKAYDGANQVNVTERASDYIVVNCTDPSGNPTDPSEISVEIIRVS